MIRINNVEVDVMFHKSQAVSCFSFLGVSGARFTACREYLDFAGREITSVVPAESFAWCDAVAEDFSDLGTCNHYLGSVMVPR